jgi:hypothetical protein
MSGKIVAINCTSHGGGGTVMLKIAETARKNGYKYITYGPEEYTDGIEEHNFFVSTFINKVNVKLTCLTGYDNAIINHGTKKLLKEISYDSHNFVESTRQENSENDEYETDNLSFDQSEKNKNVISIGWGLTAIVSSQLIIFFVFYHDRLPFGIKLC